MVVTGPVRSNSGWQSATAVVATISGENGANREIARRCRDGARGRRREGPDGSGARGRGGRLGRRGSRAASHSGRPALRQRYSARSSRSVGLRVRPGEATAPPGDPGGASGRWRGRAVLPRTARRGERLVRSPARVRQRPPQPRSRQAGERGPAGRGDGRHRGDRPGVDGRVPAIRHGAHALGQRPARRQPGRHRDRPGRICPAVPQGRFCTGRCRRAAHGPLCGLLSTHRPVGGHDRGRPRRALGREKARPVARTGLRRARRADASTPSPSSTSGSSCRSVPLPGCSRS